MQRSTKMKSNCEPRHTSRDRGTTLLEYSLIGVCISTVIIATGTYIGRNSHDAVLAAGKSMSTEASPDMPSFYDESFDRGGGGSDGGANLGD